MAVVAMEFFGILYSSAAMGVAFVLAWRNYHS
jgi:hypothetical protein